MPVIQLYAITSRQLFPAFKSTVAQAVSAVGKKQYYTRRGFASHSCIVFFMEKAETLQNTIDFAIEVGLWLRLKGPPGMLYM